MRDREYRNPKNPITDMFTALTALQHGWNDRTNRYLHRRLGEDPYIEVRHLNSMDEWVKSTNFLLAPALAEEIFRRGYALGVLHPGWTDEYKLRISDRGGQELRRLWDIKVDEAKAKLQPGIHGQSRLYTYAGTQWLHREGDRHDGHEYIAFSTPFGDVFGVFTDGTIVQIKKNNKDVFTEWSMPQMTAS